MGLRNMLGIRYPIVDPDTGNLRCWNCTANLTGQSFVGNQPIRCPGCRAKNFPDRRGSGMLYRNR